MQCQQNCFIMNVVLIVAIIVIIIPSNGLITRAQEKPRLSPSRTTRIPSPTTPECLTFSRPKKKSSFY